MTKFMPELCLKNVIDFVSHLSFSLLPLFKWRVAVFDVGLGELYKFDFCVVQMALYDHLELTLVCICNGYNVHTLI